MIVGATQRFSVCGGNPLGSTFLRFPIFFDLQQHDDLVMWHLRGDLHFHDDACMALVDESASVFKLLSLVTGV